MRRHNKKINLELHFFCVDQWFPLLVKWAMLSNLLIKTYKYFMGQYTMFLKLAGILISVSTRGTMLDNKGEQRTSQYNQQPWARRCMHKQQAKLCCLETWCTLTSSFSTMFGQHWQHLASSTTWPSSRSWLRRNFARGQRSSQSYWLPSATCCISSLRKEKVNLLHL